MIGGSKPRGYTVVEIMIFLAVSGLLAVSSMTLISGRQNNAQFAQAVRELDNNLRDIINDVSTGYYPNSDQLTCNYSSPGTPGTGITLTNLPKTQGTNSDCIFVGRVIHFAPSGTNLSSIRVHSVAGQRQRAGGQEVRDIIEAKSEMIAKESVADITTPEVYEDVDFGSALEIQKIQFLDPNIPTPPPGETRHHTSAVGFFTSFNTYNGTFLNSGSTNTILIPFASSKVTDPGLPVPDYFDFAINQSPTQFVGFVNKRLSNLGKDSTSMVKSSDPTYVKICVISKTTKAYAVITIGDNNRKLTTNVVTTTTTGAPACPITL